MQIFEMVLVANEKAWTIGFCSIYILHNTILAKTWKSDNEKVSVYFFCISLIHCVFSYLKPQGQLLFGSGVNEKNYKLEDFFWTGSGDGTVTDDALRNNTYDTDAIIDGFFDDRKTTTVFHTTTILFATVYPNNRNCFDDDCSPKISPTFIESIDYSMPEFSSTNVSKIQPTPSVKITQFSTQKISKSLNGQTNSVVSTGTELPFTTAKTFTSNNFFISNSEPYHTHIINEINSTTTVFPKIFIDQKYWLLTVLKNDNHLPSLNVSLTEEKLSNLYRQAFTRQKNEFFKENNLTDEKKMESVKAHIINITSIGTELGLVYLITISGRPVLANTAANDMRLMTPSEIVAELGRPVLTKAEPYVKVEVPPRARVKGRTRDTWLLIGCIIAAICLLLLLVGGFALILSKKKNKKKTEISKDKEGSSNLAFDEDADVKAEYSSKLPHSFGRNSKEQDFENESDIATVKFKEKSRESSTSSSNGSGSLETGLVRFHYQQTKKDVRRGGRERPKPKPRARERRIQSSDFRNNDCRRTCSTSGTSKLSKHNFIESASDEYSPRVTKSPTSYLSMPSVKAFPRGTKIPDPLNKILEPTSIRHLDADSDSQKESSRPAHIQRVQVEVEREMREESNKFVKGKKMTRHASLEGEDPGVIGPVVWNKHCQKILRRDLLMENQYDNVNPSRMRKRFNKLLSEALSMTGSNNQSSEENDLESSAGQAENRVYSATMRPKDLNAERTTACRPNTTGSKRPQSSTVSGPKGAWETPSCSTLAPHLSACKCEKVSVSPEIDKNLIYVNSELSPSDPAIPLIAAIKNELKKLGNSPETSSGK